MRLIVADDSMLFREGLVRVLQERGFDVVGQTDNGEDVVRRAAPLHADVALIDIRMPPSFTDEGLQAALALGERNPEIGVLLLSQFVESATAIRLLEHSETGRGYLLKDRISDLDAFAESIRRVGEGGSVIDPEVFSAMAGTSKLTIAGMSAREQEILSLMAEGRSNQGICERLFLSPRTIESHVRTIFQKLGLEETDDDNRRVLAVLAYLRS